VLDSVVAALLSMYPLKNLVFSAAFTLHCCALRRASGGATMTTAGGAGTTPLYGGQPCDFPERARLTGFHRLGAF
jgi:hypothetical protein